MIVTLLRKPLSDNTLCSLPCATLNIDASRTSMSPADQEACLRLFGFRNTKSIGGIESGMLGGGQITDRSEYDPSLGRFPANLIVSRLVAPILDIQSGFSRNAGKPIARSTKDESTGWHMRQDTTGTRHADSGGASRYFKVVA